MPEGLKSVPDEAKKLANFTNARSMNSKTFGEI
jgi:hypothetical protein